MNIDRTHGKEKSAKPDKAGHEMEGLGNDDSLRKHGYKYRKENTDKPLTRPLTKRWFSPRINKDENGLITVTVETTKRRGTIYCKFKSPNQLLKEHIL